MRPELGLCLELGLVPDFKLGLGERRRAHHASCPACSSRRNVFTRTRALLMAGVAYTSHRANHSIPGKST